MRCVCVSHRRRGRVATVPDGGRWGDGGFVIEFVFGRVCVIGYVRKIRILRRIYACILMSLSDAVSSIKIHHTIQDTRRERIHVPLNIQNVRIRISSPTSNFLDLAALGCALDARCAGSSPWGEVYQCSSLLLFVGDSRPPAAAMPLCEPVFFHTMCAPVERSAV